MEFRCWFQTGIKVREVQKQRKTNAKTVVDILSVLPSQGEVAAISYEDETLVPCM